MIRHLDVPSGEEACECWITLAPNWIGLWVKGSVAHIAVSRINISIEAKQRLT
jgi:hypothetical protein